MIEFIEDEVKVEDVGRGGDAGARRFGTVAIGGGGACCILSRRIRALVYMCYSIVSIFIISKVFKVYIKRFRFILLC